MDHVILAAKTGRTVQPVKIIQADTGPAELQAAETQKRADIQQYLQYAAENQRRENVLYWEYQARRLKRTKFILMCYNDYYSGR